MNVVTLIGRLTRDCEIRTYGEANDKKMARFSLAVDRRGKREEGQQNADFITCVCYGRLADFADGYFRQGTKIALRGSIRTGSYTNKDGIKVYTTDVIADEVEFAESKRSADQNAAPKPAQAAAPAGDGFVNVADSGIEEDLPFA